MAAGASQDEKDALERARAADEARKLVILSAKDREATLSVRQAASRQKKGQLADTGASDISQEIKAYLDAKGQPDPGLRAYEVARLYPALANWYRSALLDHWALESANSELLDYGNVDWKGRKLEAVFSTIRIKLKNAMLGGYQEGCFVVGHVIDHEFKVSRDDTAISCDDHESLSAWKAGHSFDSVWVLN